MKTKLFLLTAIATTLMFFSCGGKSDFDSDPFNHFYKNKADVDDDDDDKKDDLGKMPTSKDFYHRMLTEFCQRYYSANFGKRFKNFSKIGNIKVEDDSTAFTSGKIYYYTKKRGNKTREAEFKATITRIARDMYRITFEKKEEKYWDDTTQSLSFKEDKK